jgi:hypothetical protein
MPKKGKHEKRRVFRLSEDVLPVDGLAYKAGASMKALCGSHLPFWIRVVGYNGGCLNVADHMEIQDVEEEDSFVAIYI